MRRRAVLLGVLLCASTARAAEVSFTLTVDYEILGRALRDALEADRGGEAVLWGTRTGCRSLVLRDIGIEPGEGRVRVVARGTARLGFGFLGFCLAPVSWNDYLASLATPEVSGDWQLWFRDLDSHLYDAERRRTVVAGRLWELVKGRLEDRLEAFRFELAPPIDEAVALIRASAPPEHLEPVLVALRTFRPRGVAADADGVKVQVAVDLPPPPPPPAIPVPEAPLTPEELQRWQAALESWDAFLVFVIKDLGLSGRDPTVRNELFDLLLTSRYELLAALAGEPQPGVDPVRRLFLHAWDRLHDVVHRAALRGGLEGRALRYATFLAAGDALAAVDAAGPSLGLASCPSAPGRTPRPRSMRGPRRPRAPGGGRVPGRPTPPTCRRPGRWPRWSGGSTAGSRTTTSCPSTGTRSTGCSTTWLPRPASGTRSTRGSRTRFRTWSRPSPGRRAAGGSSCAGAAK